ncbi:MAG: zinc-binding alcohol dehydrogenase [Planctomycetaceae bacterium]
MKIAILHGPRDLRIEDHPLETDNLAPHQIWIQTRISALKIGTDRGNFEGAEQVPGAPDFPRWVGDSNLGVVCGVGSLVTDFSIGDRVVSNLPHQSDLVIDDDGPVVRVPDGADDEDAVYAWLSALSALCYRRANFQPGENVAIVGLGVLGLGAVALGPLFGARTIGIANSPVRLEMAENIGAHAGFLSDDPDLQSGINQFTRGEGVDLVILTANPWPAHRTALEIVRPGGRVAIVALSGRGEASLDFNPLAMELFYNKGISLIAVSHRAGSMFPADGRDRFDRKTAVRYVLDLMADGTLKPGSLITHRMPYSEMATAYEMIDRREKSMLGVIFEWNGSD